MRSIARQNWPIAVVPNRNRERENFEETGEVLRSGAAKSAHHAITGGRGVTFLFIYFADRNRQLARSEKEIANPAAEFARGARNRFPAGPECRRSRLLQMQHRSAR